MSDRDHNEVFKGNASASSVFSAQPQAAQPKTDSGLDFPVAVESVPLPSLGKVYPANSSLSCCDLLEIKAMTTREEDILTSKAYLKKGTVISELIKSCLIDKTIDPRDMLTGDRNALMIAIRITGYGADYEAELECSECGNKSPRTFNLSALQIKSLEIDPVDSNSNLFSFTLPVCKKNVQFRFLTGRDEEDIIAMTEKQRKLGLPAETTVTTSLLHSIVSIEGIEDRTKISNFIKAMPARDSLVLRTFINDNEPGVDMHQETTCPICGHVEEVMMPLGVTFLWPQARK